jgi:hypothetical protein
LAPNNSEEMYMAAIIHSKRYTMREVARLLQVHVATIWRWHLHGVRGRRLRTITIGARRYVLDADLDAFLAAGSGDESSPSGHAMERRAQDAGRALDGLGVSVRSKPARTAGACS